MKKQLLQKQRGILLALLCFLCVTSINAQTLLYENDFESSNGLLGSTIVGNGVMEASGDAAHGQVFHNDPTLTNAIRTNYLKLPETIFSAFEANETQGLTVSFWVNKSNATNYGWSPMFGAYGANALANAGSWENKPAFLLTARSNWVVNFDYINAVDGINYGSKYFDQSGNYTTWLDIGGWHFYTFTITPTTAIVYVDGVVKNQWTWTDTNGVGGLFNVASELKYVTLGGFQAFGWNDPDPAFSFDKLKIYAGALTTGQIGSLKATDVLTTPVIIASTSSIPFEGTTSASFTVSGANLTNAITLTPPQGITLSTYSIPTNPTDVSVTVTYDGTTPVDGNIVLSDGTATANVAVKSYDYCFTPLYPTGNMIADPYCNFYLANGWGTKSINTDPAYVYCGYSSGHTINGSIDRALNGTNGNALWEGNTLYRVKAMVYGISGNVGVGVYGAGGNDIGHSVYANGAWETIDFTFTTGASPNGGIFFNNGEGYIDNWEMYAVSADQVATQADKDALNARITTATNLLTSTTQGVAYGQYTTANRTTLQNLINSSTTLSGNSSALMVAVTNASLALASAMTTYSNSMIPLDNGDYFIKIGGLYVTDPGSSITDGTSPKISNNGLQSQIIAGNSQIYTIARVSGSDRTTEIERYSFFNKATSRNLNESALIKDAWGGTGDDVWRTQNIYYNGTNYAIKSGGNAAYFGMWYLKNGNELATNGINRTPIAADYVFELVPVNANLTTSGDVNLNSTVNSLSRLPNSGDYVTVLSGTLTIDQDVTVHSLTIDPGAKVTLSSGSSLAVTGNFAINSDATTGTGTFVDANAAGGLTVSGTSTVQQYITGAGGVTPNTRFWYFSSPLTGATSTAFAVESASPKNKLWSFSEAAYGYTLITTNATGLTIGRGYVARLGDNKTVALTGTLNSGDLNITATRTGTELAKRGYNLLGNPYPSYLDINAAFNSTSTTNLESTIWYRSFNSSTNIMAFDTYNAFDGAGISLGSGGTALTNYIPPMQAFWVRATTDGVSGHLALTNAMRSNQASGNKLRSAMVDTIRIEKIRLQITNGRGIDQALIGIYPQAKDSFERYDSHKMFNDNDSIPEIYTFAGEEEVAINGLAPFVGRKDMKLGFRTRKPGRFTIKALELSNLEAGTKILLKDNVLNVSQDLAETPEYTFVSDAAATTDRFTLTLVKAATAIGNTQKSSISIRSLNGGRMEINLEGSNKANVKVYDMIGKMVFAQDINSQNSTLSKTFSKGVYLVKVSVNGMEFAKKVAINQ